MNFREVIQEYYNIYLQYYKDGKVYGTSSEDLLDFIAPHVIGLNPKSILDYGCGRSSLIRNFWNDGKRELYKYDPAIREYRDIPIEKVDLVLCTDVLEHIPIGFMPKFLYNLSNFSQKAIISVSFVPARQKLSNGKNAHITLLKQAKWEELLAPVYDEINILKTHKTGMILKTWH